MYLTAEEANVVEILAEVCGADHWLGVDRNNQLYDPETGKTLDTYETLNALFCQLCSCDLDALTDYEYDVLESLRTKVYE